MFEPNSIMTKSFAFLFAAICYTFCIMCVLVSYELIKYYAQEFKELSVKFKNRRLSMKISEEINAIRDKYDPNKGKKVLKTSSFCKNSYAYSLHECQHCCMCGREFDEKGNLIREAHDE